MRRFIYLAIFAGAFIGFGHSHASAQVINGCIKGNGTLKIVTDPTDCSDRETPISWNVEDPNAPRFEDCGDGTVADHQTGLQWEKKTGTWVDPGVVCEFAACPEDPHDVNIRYRWSNTGTEPDGRAFTNFVARLNANLDPWNPTGCFADRCDWRLPEISELQTILIGPDAAPGQDTTSCVPGPCIDPDFAAVGGPTAPYIYWSASTTVGVPTSAWYANFVVGIVDDSVKPDAFYVRGVRAGSCH